MRRSTRLLLATGLSLVLCTASRGQDEPGAGASRGSAETTRSRRKPKPAQKPGEPVLELRKGVSSEPASSGQGEAPAEAITGMATTAPAPAPAPRAPSALSIACDAGQAVHYEGEKAGSVWVTRSGSVTIDNPLRPLTPDVTRVLQLVVGDRIATAFGADFSALKRGTSPAALEGVLGGPIRWDAKLPVLPETLNIVADSGASLAELPFRDCGQAPAARAASVAKARDGTKPPAARAKAVKPESPPAPNSAATVTAGAPSTTATRPRPMSIPRGAISE